MTIKVFVSSISGNKEVKKQQQHVLFVMTGHGIEFREIDIADPSNEEEKQMMLEHSTPNAKGSIIPPQIFNDETYCGVSEQENKQNKFLFIFCLFKGL